MRTKQLPTRPVAVLSDAEWRSIRDLLPLENGRVGRPRNALRNMVNACLYLHHSGGSMRTLPEHFGSWQTAYHNLHEWRKSGLWKRITRRIAS